MRNRRHSCVLAGAAAFFAANQLNGAVGLIFTNGGATPSSATVASGATFPVSVKLTESLATDKVNGVSYRFHASTNGVFEFLSRNSQTTGGQFTFDNDDGDSTDTPYTLNILNDGHDLGAGTATDANVSGPNTYEIADFSFEVLPSAPTGVYTLSFSNSSYSTNGSTSSPAFASLGTYTVSVPEPASIALIGIFGAGLTLRRHRPSLAHGGCDV